ncbi:copper resistance protein CopC, partial [Streptosporangium sp. NPDC006013]
RPRGPARWSRSSRAPLLRTAHRHDGGPAEAAQNGGAGMAVLWIAASIVLLGGATVVAMRRTKEGGAR